TTDPSLDSLVKVNQGTHASIWNSVLVTAPASANQKQADVCFDISGTGTTIELLSNHFSCDKRDKNAATTGYVDAADRAGTVFAASTLGSDYVNGANEAAVTPIPVKARHGAFEDVDYIGAAKDANGVWWTGWTVGLD